MDTSKRMRVLSPITSKEGKTFWMRAGIAHGNKDGSINLYLDMLPTNGRLQIREWDEPDRRGTGAESQPYQPSLEMSASAGDQLPF